jgi:5-methylcytosine-specific restriction endonuclease McrA
MTLRRYKELKASRGTVIPADIRKAVLARDGWRCVCRAADFPEAVVAACPGLPVELDHVRSSNAMGKKSESTTANLVCLSNSCHRWRTEHGREGRPLLLDYLARMGSENTV